MSWVGSKITVKIEKMTVGGAGLARHNGLVVFVDYAAPGDELEVEITEYKKNLAYGKILKIITPGSGRVTPLCSHFGECGGCSWQHLSRDEQLAQKELLVRDALKEIRKIKNFEMEHIIPSPQFYHYRNRVQMTFDGERFGFMGKRSNRLVKIEKCFLVEETLNTLIQNPDGKKLKKDSRYDLRVSAPDGLPQLTDLQQDVDLVGFSQVNRFQNPDLISAALSSIKFDSNSDLYEFYAGAGNFTFPFFNEFKFSHLWAVENSSALVKVAQKEINQKNISNRKLSFHLGAVESFLKTQWPRSQDVVFLDPPRIGAEESVIKTLALSKPRQIVYLSCHPVTLARDLGRLLKLSPKYEIDFVKIFEMFPHTDHVETLVSLSLTEK